jgi:hypothetical protein
MCYCIVFYLCFYCVQLLRSYCVTCYCVVCYCVLCYYVLLLCTILLLTVTVYCVTVHCYCVLLLRAVTAQMLLCSMLRRANTA